MTVSLHPRDLGQVDIRVSRPGDGSTVVTVTASEPQTLHELYANTHHLHAALDAANIPTDNRTLSFAVAASVEPDHQQQNASSGGDPSTNQDQGSNAPGYQRQASQQERNRQTPQTPSNGTTRYDVSPAITRRTWQINGLNITA